MGRLDPAVLSLCRSRRFNEALVFVRLSVGRRCNAQRTIAAGCAFFCSLAAVAKEMDARTAIARGVCVDDGAWWFRHGFCALQRRGLWSRLLAASVALILFRPKISACVGVGGRYDCSGSVRRRSVRRRQICVAANWFSLRQRALSISLHQLVLQLAIPSRPSRLVVKRFAVVV